MPRVWKATDGPGGIISGDWFRDPLARRNGILIHSANAELTHPDPKPKDHE